MAENAAFRNAEAPSNRAEAEQTFPDAVDDSLWMTENNCLAPLCSIPLLAKDSVSIWHLEGCTPHAHSN